MGDRLWNNRTGPGEQSLTAETSWLLTRWVPWESWSDAIRRSVLTLTLFSGSKLGFFFRRGLNDDGDRMKLYA